MKKINVLASKWRGGWELEISEHQHTQAVKLSEARQQVIDYLDTVEPETDHSGWEINIVLDLGGLDTALLEAQETNRKAIKAQEESKKQVVNAIKALHKAGVTMADIATVMGVSKARVSQLAK